MSSGGGGGGLATDANPSSRDSNEFTLEELLWVWSAEAGDGNVRADLRGNPQAYVANAQKGGKRVSATEIERIMKLRGQRDREMNLSAAAAAEEKTLNQNAVKNQATGATTSGSTPQATDAAQVEQDMYTQFLGL